MLPKGILALVVVVVTIPATDASRVFALAQSRCEADAGRLWGVSLCVPIMLADATTLQAVTNRPAPGATREDGIFRLTLPAGSQVADAPFSYDGIAWAQISWPTSAGADARAVTLMHESFHIVQPTLGFNGNADNGSISGDAFLDTQAGRVWLRGEFAALRVALQNSGDLRVRAIGDAVAMRLYRHTLSATTAELERQLDVLEGLAEGTGIDAGLPPERRIPYSLHDIAFVEPLPSYARSFAYATGPAYTELLDAAQPNWRRAVTPASDIAVMTMQAYGLNVTTPTASGAQAIIERYGGHAIEAQETARAARKATLDAKYRSELVAGPTLTLPMMNFHIRFNPTDIEALDPYGTVYHALSVSAPWGSIDVTGGDAMISKDFRLLTVGAPGSTRGSAVHGAAWMLTLSPGYTIVPDPQKPGSYTVSKQ
jgi:hypothetical protein